MGADRAESKSQARKWPLTVLFVAAVLLSVVPAYKYWKMPRPAPPAAPPLPISKADEQKIREEMHALGKTLLGVTPEQEKKIEAIWQRFPTTVDELVAFNKKTDEALTDKQRLVLRPIQRMMRHKAIDRMLESSRPRFPPQDFERFRQAIKDRVDKRVEQ